MKTAHKPWSLTKHVPSFLLFSALAAQAQSGGAVFQNCLEHPAGVVEVFSAQNDDAPTCLESSRDIQSQTEENPGHFYICAILNGQDAMGPISSSTGVMIETHSCAGVEKSKKILQQLNREVNQLQSCFNGRGAISYPHPELASVLWQLKESIATDNYGINIRCQLPAQMGTAIASASSSLRTISISKTYIDQFEYYQSRGVLGHEWMHLTQMIGPYSEIDNYPTQEHNSIMVESDYDRVYACSNLCLSTSLPSRESCETCMHYPDDIDAKSVVDYRDSPSEQCRSLPWSDDYVKIGSYFQDAMKQVISCGQLHVSQRTKCLQTQLEQLPALKKQVLQKLAPQAIDYDPRLIKVVEAGIDGSIKFQIEYMLKQKY